MTLTGEDGASPPRGRVRASIYDVASQAGVSHMTVSRVLNGHPNIRASTRERVLQAIDELNYTRNSAARALATSRSMRIGVLVDAPVEYGPNSTLRAIERAAREVGYAVSSFSTADDAELSIDNGVVDLVTQGVDGLCVVAPRSASLDLLHRQSTGLPTLAITAASEHDMLTASVDQHLGAELAVRHLIELGHRRIVHLAGPLDWLDARAREQSWRRVMTEAALPVLEPIVGDWSSDSGFEAALHSPLIDQATAIFAANDQMALGVLHGLAKRGLRVPEDVSVVGFDDLPDARHFQPPLTTVRQDFEALGALSVSMLLRAIDGDTSVGSEHIAPTLLVRESTAVPAARI